MGIWFLLPCVIFVLFFCPSRRRQILILVYLRSKGKLWNRNALKIIQPRGNSRTPQWEMLVSGCISNCLHSIHSSPNSGNRSRGKKPEPDCLEEATGEGRAYNTLHSSKATALILQVRRSSWWKAGREQRNDHCVRAALPYQNTVSEVNGEIKPDHCSF